VTNTNHNPGTLSQKKAWAIACAMLMRGALHFNAQANPNASHSIRKYASGFLRKDGAGYASGLPVLWLALGLEYADSGWIGEELGTRHTIDSPEAITSVTLYCPFRTSPLAELRIAFLLLSKG
jgi:hypothetical protein